MINDDEDKVDTEPSATLDSQPFALSSEAMRGISPRQATHQEERPRTRCLPNLVCGWWAQKCQRHNHDATRWTITHQRHVRRSREAFDLPSRCCESSQCVGGNDAHTTYRTHCLTHADLPRSSASSLPRHLRVFITISVVVPPEAVGHFALALTCTRGTW